MVTWATGYVGRPLVSHLLDLGGTVQALPRDHCSAAPAIRKRCSVCYRRHGSSPRLYRRSRVDVAALLVALVRLPHCHVQHRRNVLRPTELYGAINLDFGHVMIVAAIEEAQSPFLYSCDGAMATLIDSAESKGTRPDRQDSVEYQPRRALHS